MCLLLRKWILDSMDSIRSIYLLDLHILGENASPLNSINGFKSLNDLIAVKNLAAPPIGSRDEFGSTL